MYVINNSGRVVRGRRRGRTGGGWAHRRGRGCRGRVVLKRDGMRKGGASLLLILVV